MSFIRDFTGIVLFVASCFSIPWGAFCLVMGVSGQLSDLNLIENMSIGLTQFAICSLPPLALWFLLRRFYWRK